MQRVYFFSVVIVLYPGWNAYWNCFCFRFKEKIECIDWFNWLYVSELVITKYFYTWDFSDKSSQTNISFSLLTEGVDQWWELRVRIGILKLHILLNLRLLCLLKGQLKIFTFNGQVDNVFSVFFVFVYTGVQAKGTVPHVKWICSRTRCIDNCI